MLTFSLAAAQARRGQWSRSHYTLGDTHGQEDAPDDCNHCVGDSRYEDFQHEQPMGVQE